MSFKREFYNGAIITFMVFIPGMILGYATEFTLLLICLILIRFVAIDKTKTTAKSEGERK